MDGSLLRSAITTGTLKVIVYPATWLLAEDKSKYFPIFDDQGYKKSDVRSSINFVMFDCYNNELIDYSFLDAFANDETVVICLSSQNRLPMHAVRRMFVELSTRRIKNPVVLIVDSTQ